MLDSTTPVSPRTNAGEATSVATHLRQPAEYYPHEACWLAWPSHAELWKEDLEPARREFVALCEAIADLDPVLHVPRGERLEILVPDAEQEKLARAALSGVHARFHVIPFGDIWLRDTAPIFVHSPSGAVAAARFGFNGWGGKYQLAHDDQVATRIAQETGRPSIQVPWVMEGGSLEIDGEGTVLTTRQCLLNPNRNPGLSQTEIESVLQTVIGAQKVLWLEEGLENDHTDGHVDTLARFAQPGVVLAMEPSGVEDPNHDVLTRILRDLESFTDARGRRLHVVKVPSPGLVMSEDSEKVMPASYLNFYISNTSVIVPIYGVPNDARAVAAISAAFPDRRTIGLPARAILTGGGAFHCITQQQPIAKGPRSV